MYIRYMSLNGGKNAPCRFFAGFCFNSYRRNRTTKQPTNQCDRKCLAKCFFSFAHRNWWTDRRMDGHTTLELFHTRKKVEKTLSKALNNANQQPNKTLQKQQPKWRKFETFKQNENIANCRSPCLSVSSTTPPLLLLLLQRSRRNVTTIKYETRKMLIEVLQI